VKPRKLIRLLGWILLGAGVLLIAWGFVIWRWGDPVTGAYTAWQQHRLDGEYHELVEHYTPPRVTPAETRAEQRQALRRAAQRFRKQSDEGAAIGKLHVDRLGLDMVLLNGTDTATLKKGPGRDERTYMPGEGQLVYIAGHRTTYGAPFAHIDRLRRGDLVVVDMPYGSFRYRVTSSVIVPSDDIARLESHGREVIALQACHPRFSARERYIVYAAPVAAAASTSGGTATAAPAS
jgi:sortase A